MALVTKTSLYEDVAALVEGGDPSTGAKYEKRMIEAFIAQAINKRLRIGYSTITLPEGETIPDNLVLACYDQIGVSTYKGKYSRAKLPAMPISLRRNMGVFFVGPAAAGNINTSPVTVSTVIVLEGFIGSAFVVIGTTNTITGLTAGSKTITIGDFAGKDIDYVVRGSILVPGVMPSDGTTYYTKNKASTSITFSDPLQPGEYLKIKTIDIYA